MKKCLIICAVLLTAISSQVSASATQSEPGIKCSDLFPPLTIGNLTPEPSPPPRTFHPLVTLLDADSEPVLDSNGPVSFMETCGGCHDSTYIATHQYHATAGMDEMDRYISEKTGRPWDLSPGLFGKWDPLMYRMLSPEAAERPDMGTADWIRVMAARHPGGGPAEISRFTGEKLGTMESDGTFHPDTHVVDPDTGEPVPWDWDVSGTVELNCVLCHISAPNNAARVQEIEQGRFRWASTATLDGTGIVSRNGDAWEWNADAFDADGKVKPEIFRLGDPEPGNCRLCHGRACRCADPVIFDNSLNNWTTETTGEVFSPELLVRSGMNVKGKSELVQPWDLHAQRLLKCTQCHFSPNNPAYDTKENDTIGPGHLRFDARKNAIGDYLDQPDHDLAKGYSSQSTVYRHRNGTMRDCRDCHEAQVTHTFLPYKELHFEKLSCQVCHIPRVNAPARQMTDWTVLVSPGKPMVSYRGSTGAVNDPAVLIDGYEPVLLRQKGPAGNRLKPHNLITSFYWTAGTPKVPVRLFDLDRLYFNADGSYRSEIITLLDDDGNGELTESELPLMSAADVAGIRKELEAMGLTLPTIQGEIQPFSLSHGVMTNQYAMRDCQDCHSADSRISTVITLSEYAPADVLPVAATDTRARLEGVVRRAEDGSVLFQSDLDPEILYIHGSDRLKWMDILGMLMVGMVIGGSAIHGGIRLLITYWKRRRQ